MALSILNEANKPQRGKKSQEKKIPLKPRKNLRRKTLQQGLNSSQTVSELEPSLAQMTAFYPHFVPASYSYPLVVADWNPGIILPSPMFTPPIQHIPIAIVSPYSYMAPEPSLPPNTVPEVPEPVIYTPENSLIHSLKPDEDGTSDPLEFYLTLPKALFPTARMLTIDPNPLINEFCKMEAVDDHSAWILDLEFGIPRVPITRAIPIYDVNLNSVQCKNTPRAIHPGFESCSEEFKRIFLFYYDCIISAWYRGYIFLSHDKSVENFQSWLLLPMQILGMCWP